MKNRAAFAILILLVTAGALAFRLPRLSQRPMHTDEAVHAYKLGQLLEKGYYRYNPVEFHGPTLNYLTLPIAWVGGIYRHADLTETALRLVPVVFGVLLVLLLLGVGDGLGGPAAVAAGVLTAVSTPMVFYSRYYIMEVLLVCFTFLAIVGAWRFVRSGRLIWCVVAGVGVGLMHATKETWVLAAAAALCALAAEAAWGRWVDRQPLPLRRHVVNWRVAVGLAAAVVVAVVFLSAFFTDAGGPLDSVLTYVHGLRRAGGGAGEEAGNLHVNPWDFYLRRLIWFRYGRGPIWSEALVAVLAVAGAIAGFARRGLGRADARFVRFLAVYSFVLLAIYSVIPYKTPWCMLGPHHGLILLAGVGVGAVVRAPAGLWTWLVKGADPDTTRLVRWGVALPQQLIVVLLVAAAAGQLAWQAHRGSFILYDRNYNPWVYAHTLRDTVRLGRRADELAELHPAGHRMRINIFAPDPHDHWPLPWYLRRFDQDRIGFVQQLPPDPRTDLDADMIIFVPEMWRELKPRLRRQYEWEHRGLRPDVVLIVGVDNKLWRKFRARLEAAQKAARR